MHVEQDRFIQMTQSPLKGLILRMAVPSMASMLVTAIYNVVDTYFVGFIGTSATGAVGVVFSLMAIIMAMGLFLAKVPATPYPGPWGSNGRRRHPICYPQGFSAVLG